MANSPPRSPHANDVVEEERFHSTVHQQDVAYRKKAIEIPDLRVPDEGETAVDEDEEEDEGDDMGESTEFEASTMSPGLSLNSEQPIMASASDRRVARKAAVKRKRGKGKGKSKGKANPKRLQAINGKLQILTEGLKPIPFIPNKVLDFAKHELILKKLGLWDFVHLDFDTNIRVDLLSELVATYESKSRVSYVRGFRIPVNRSSLARALSLPLKKEKGNVGVVEADLDHESLADDSVAFIATLFSYWMLLHEDMWIMPNEVKVLMELINDGHPEKVDWAVLFWFMVEKELKKGAQLKDCYYASHLQHLIKAHRPELLLMAEPTVETMELELKLKEIEKEDQVDQVKFMDAMVSGEDGKPEEEEVHVIAEPSTELTLGQDVKDSEIMNAETSKGIHEDGVRGEDEEHEHEDEAEVGHRPWLLDGNNSMGQHYLQRCSAENSVGFGSINDREEEEEVYGMEEDEVQGEEDEEDEMQHFHDFAGEEDALEGVEFTGNLLQEFEENQVIPDSQDQLHNSANIGIGVQQISSKTPVFRPSGKRMMEHDHGLQHLMINDSNKRPRILDSWNDQPMDFGTCMESIMQMCRRAKMKYDEKEQTMAEMNMNQEIMLAEIQKRDSTLEHLHKARQDDLQKKNAEIYRLERELYLMSKVVDGYRSALKASEKSFSEYRARARLSEKPTYKDVGFGGVMLTNAEIERLRKQQEEEWLINEQKIKEFEQQWCSTFTWCYEKVNLCNERLTNVEAAYKELLQVHGRRKGVQTQGEVDEAAEPFQATESQAVKSHVEELDSISQLAGELQVAEPGSTPHAEELQVATPESTPETKDDLQVTGPDPNTTANEEALVVKSSQIPQDEAEADGVAAPSLDE